MTSACALPCTEEGAACALMGRRALLLTEDPEVGATLTAFLRLLGLEAVRPGRTRLGTPILPPRVDLVLAAGATDLRRASDLIDLVREERCWVPVILARTVGAARLLDAERGVEATPSEAGNLATLIVRALCRTARHHPPRGRACPHGQAAAAPSA